MEMKASDARLPVRCGARVAAVVISTLEITKEHCAPLSGSRDLPGRGKENGGVEGGREGSSSEEGVVGERKK